MIKIKRPGKLHEEMGIPKCKPIPTAKIEKVKAAAKKSDDVAEEKRAVFALNARKWGKK